VVAPSRNGVRNAQVDARLGQRLRLPAPFLADDARYFAQEIAPAKPCAIRPPERSEHLAAKAGGDKRQRCGDVLRGQIGDSTAANVVTHGGWIQAGD